VFTGIVEELGRVRERDGGRLVFEGPLVSEDARVGDSIAVNGCCLTVTATGEGWWTADAVEETLSRTNLDRLAPGDPVNLERPVRLSDRLGGHLVQGHVDAVGTILEPAPALRVSAPAAVLRYVVEKGSITVDGVSLTVVEVTADSFSAAIVPHTVRATTLGHRRPGEPVNLEIDVIAKYTERLLAGGATTAGPGGRPYCPAERGGP
jgi:riboflavin synthase